MTFTVPESAIHYIRMHRTHIQPEEYQESCLQDYTMIYKYLPEKVGSIIDIGCGMAGIDVFLKRRYPDAELYLLDGDGDEFACGWNDTMKPFSSREAAEELLGLNGIKVTGWLPVNTKKKLKADLIISLLSYGFHYPISAYDCEGTMLCDLRTGMEPKRGTVIAYNNKYNRCIWTQ
jgi:hypothetical protein